MSTTAIQLQHRYCNVFQAPTVHRSRTVQQLSATCFFVWRPIEALFSVGSVQDISSKHCQVRWWSTGRSYWFIYLRVDADKREWCWPPMRILNKLNSWWVVYGEKRQSWSLTIQRSQSWLSGGQLTRIWSTLRVSRKLIRFTHLIDFMDLRKREGISIENN